MNVDQAEAVLACLWAYYPRTPAPGDDTKTAWASALHDVDLLDGLAAANELGGSSKFLPALAELLAATRAARAERSAHLPARTLPGNAPAVGVTFVDWVHDHATREQRRTVARVFPTLAERYGVTAELLDDHRHPCSPTRGSRDRRRARAEGSRVVIVPAGVLLEAELADVVLAALVRYVQGERLGEAAVLRLLAELASVAARPAVHGRGVRLDVGPAETVADYAARTGTPTRTVRRWCSLGRLTATRDGGGRWQIRQNGSG